MSQGGADIKRKRIPEIDFWRGFALIVILVDHVPRNGLDKFTPKNFGFSDAAEAFVFLSGVSVSLAYASTLQKAGFWRLVKRCASRAAKLYLVQIAMVACSIAIPLAVAKIVGDQDILLGDGLSRFVASPCRRSSTPPRSPINPTFQSSSRFMSFSCSGRPLLFFWRRAVPLRRFSRPSQSTRPGAAASARPRWWLALQSLRLAALFAIRQIPRSRPSPSFAIFENGMGDTD